MEIEEKVCPYCLGLGKLKKQKRTREGITRYSGYTLCEVCEGHGKIKIRIDK